MLVTSINSIKYHTGIACRITNCKFSVGIITLFLDPSALSGSAIISIAVVIPTLFIMCAAGVFTVACWAVCRRIKRKNQKLHCKGKGATDLR